MFGKVILTTMCYRVPGYMTHELYSIDPARLKEFHCTNKRIDATGEQNCHSRIGRPYHLRLGLALITAECNGPVIVRKGPEEKLDCIFEANERLMIDDGNRQLNIPRHFFAFSPFECQVARINSRRYSQ
jgi:hypothetical protein